jgi:hypothetical protein
MRILTLIAGVATLLVTAGCRSDIPGTIVDTSVPQPQRPQWLSAAEMEALDKDEAKAKEIFDGLDVFVMFASPQAGDEAARGRHLAAAVLMVKYYLHQLFYTVDFERTDHPADDPDFYAALVAFEQRAGLQVDGKFTFAEFQRLTYLSKLEHETEISATLKFVSVSNSYAAANGTWTLQGENIAYPVNRTEIWCWRPQLTCTVFTANIALPREDDVAGAATLLTDLLHRDVIRWTASEVQARSQSDCRQTVLTINGETQQVYEVTSDLTKEGCPLLGPLDKPRVATLDDSRIILKEYEARKAAARTVSNSPLQRIRDLMRAESSAVGAQTP